MDPAWLVRARWRLRGAWMWPMFVALPVVDGIVGHALPVDGTAQSVLGGIVVALVLELIGVVVLARPLGMLLRTRRRDLPPAIARNYGGTAAVLLVTVGFVVLGGLHHWTIVSQRATMRDAVARAAAYIGDHAPAAFRANASHTDTFVIQPGTMYRTCVPDVARTRTYCVVVDERRPAARSVTPDGYESNATLSRGVD